jgi:hypothetical protein
MKLMNLIVNLIIAIFYVFIINYYLDNKYEKKDINQSIKYIIQFIFLYLLVKIFNYTNWNLLLILTLNLCISILAYKFYKILVKDIIINVMLLTILQLLILFLQIIIYEKVFELVFKSQFMLPNISYFVSKFFLGFVSIYISYFIVSLYLKHKLPEFQMNFKFFKLSSFLISILYTVFVLINIQEMFLFPRIAKTTLFTFIIYNSSLVLFNKYQVHHDKIESHLLLEKQRVEQEKRYLQEKIKSDKEIRAIRHDLKNSYLILQAYMNNEEYDKVKEFIDKRASRLINSTVIHHVGNHAVDCIIEEKMITMMEKGIQYKENITYSFLGNIIDSDIAMILALALDNAIEASQKVKGDKHIFLATYKSVNFIIFEIRNSVVEGTQLHFDRSSKIYDLKNHGFGIKEMKKYIRIYDGEYEYKIINNEVILRFMLNTQKLVKK